MRGGDMIWGYNEAPLAPNPHRDAKRGPLRDAKRDGHMLQQGLDPSPR